MTKDGSQVKELAKGKPKLFRDKRGISPVIATVVLVAVTITVAVAVAFWMGGIATQYTRFEKLEISSAYATKGGDGNFTITITVKNTGATDATLDYILINGKPLSQYTGSLDTTDTLPGSSSGVTWNATTSTIASGGDSTLTVICDGDLFDSGTTLELKLHTAAGREYPQMITLP